MHPTGQKCIACACDEWCGAASPGCMQSPGSPHEWIMNASAISKPRYSAAVNAILQSYASLPLFFLSLFLFLSPRNASPSPSTGRGREGEQAHRGELRTLNRRPNPPLFSLSLSLCFFSFILVTLFFLLCRGLDTPAISLPPPSALARLPRFRTYETKGFSSRYTEPLGLLNPPLEAFSSFPV